MILLHSIRTDSPYGQPSPFPGAQSSLSVLPADCLGAAEKAGDKPNMYPSARGLAEILTLNERLEQMQGLEVINAIAALAEYPSGSEAGIVPDPFESWNIGELALANGSDFLLEPCARGSPGPGRSPDRGTPADRRGWPRSQQGCDQRGEHGVPRRWVVDSAGSGSRSYRSRSDLNRWAMTPGLDAGPVLGEHDPDRSGGTLQNASAAQSRVRLPGRGQTRRPEPDVR